MKTKGAIPAAPVEETWRSHPVPPLPQDALYLSLDDVGGYLRRSRAAVRKLLDERPAGEDDEIGTKLRGWMVKMTDRRRYILREPFMDWYRSLIRAVR